ncbi:hypothetical protein AYO20_06423 [Fonsecaea nubica]|uniref:3-oxoacyl-[acyl-carrier-protein] reductase n=1 Tax=Fonsecaea nubica TaxID=856822 RepID=A0A178CWV5_9EURO|nr:hypothetical protein AYO20_06423 [Fonsecaea nubica]OAL34370.1 hypothetical protein AYO20_06423 [Fonsecaea nubica]
MSQPESVVIVTGASQGLGAASAVRLANIYSTIVLVARNESLLRKVAAEVEIEGAKTLTIPADLSLPESAKEVVAKTVDKFGRIDALFNNAGSVKPIDLFKLTDEQWNAGFDLKLHGARRLTIEAWPYLKASKGAVLFMSGVAAEAPKAGNAAVAVVNSAVNALSKAFADRGIEDGIQVNTILPGPVETERLVTMATQVAETKGIPLEEAKENMRKSMGISRFGKPEEIAELVAYLLSPSARWMTGSAVRIDGPLERVREGFEDAVHIARVVALTFDPCEEAFLRYFRPQEAVFVSNIFRTFANIPLDLVLTAETVVSVLTQPNAQLNTRLGDSALFIGDDLASPAERQCDGSANAWMTEDNDDRNADIYICEDIFDWPSIEDIANPPQTSWARDSHGQPRPGYSCAGLGDFDSDWMKTVGSTILHEYIHWGFLFVHVPDWYHFIRVNDRGWRAIEDYPGPNPPNGYGPYRAKLIKDTYGAWDQAYPVTVNNVDNYVYYALSKYWSWRCDRRFGPAPSDRDARQRVRSGFRPHYS